MICAPVNRWARIWRFIKSAGDQERKQPSLVGQRATFLNKTEKKYLIAQNKPTVSVGHTTKTLEHHDNTRD
jgi:hypothetical protein